jgi:hypothetical protein
MPDSAQFVVLPGTDASFILPHPQTGKTSKEIANIDLVGLDRSRTALLMFKVQARGRLHLSMLFNQAETLDIDYEFDLPGQSVDWATRTWHEVVPGTHLKELGNHLSVKGTPRSSGNTIVLSDMVIFYHATT